MIFWIFVIALVIGIILYKLSDNYNHDLHCFATIDIIVSSVVVAFLGAIIITTHFGANGEKLVKEQRYEALLYKARAESVKDDFGILNKEYIEEVQEWNEDIVIYKEWQRDFWIGIFIPNIYDDFETIDLESISLPSGNPR